MKLPSLRVLAQGISRVAMRFPLQFLLAILATGIWWYLIGVSWENSALEDNLLKLLVICNLALTLLLASDLFAEVKGYSIAKKWGLRIAVLVICTGLYFLLNPAIYLADVFRIGLLAFAFHLLVAFAPFVGKGNLNGFWQYNKTLFLRFLISALYAGVLYAGLAIALAAIDSLFNVTIGYRIYMRLFAVVSAGFTTLFFLAGIPENFATLQEDQSYPKGLKIFTQYVLIPLMTIYLGILLVYEVKTLINWQLPKGLVSTLILGYAVFGILSLLLIYPIKDKDGNGWIKLFSKLFYLMMIPLMVLLMLAIGKRVGNYGITESRYILMALALWLSAITVYFLLSKKQNIKIIPISLCIIAILATYGPQSAFSVSKYSQVARLKKMLSSKVKKEKEDEPAVIRYLVDRHGLMSLQTFTSTDLKALELNIEKKAIKNKWSKYEIKEAKIDSALSTLKVKDKYPTYVAGESIKFLNNNKGMIVVSGYDAFFAFDEYVIALDKYFDGSNFKLEKNNGASLKGKFKVTVNKVDSLVFNVDELASKLYQLSQDGKLTKKIDDYFVSSNQMQLQHVTKRYHYMLVISDINGEYNKEENKFKYLNFTGYLLIKKN